MINFMIFFLISVRITSMMLVAPFFSMRQVPNIVKLGLSLILSSLILSIYNFNIINIDNNFVLLFYIANEILIGITIGYISFFIFNSIRMSGQFVDFSIGFTMSQYFDPATSSTSTILERFFNWIALVLFITFNFHHIILSAIIKSFEVFPVGFLINNENIFYSLLYFFSKSFYISIKLAAPIIIVLFITEFTLGLIARAVPQINIFLLGMPIKVIVGLLAIATILPGLSHIYIKVFDGLNDDFIKFFNLFPLILLATEDKTEEPTPKKLKEAREKGQIAKSVDLTSAIILFGITFVLAVMSKIYYEGGKSFIIESFKFIGKSDLDYKSVFNIFLYMLKYAFIGGLPVIFTTMVLGIISNIAQVGFLISKEGLKPDLSKINPINGFKRFFSKRSVVELFKSILKIFIIAFFSYKYVSSVIFDILKVSDLNPQGIYPFVSSLLNKQLLRLVVILFILGIADYVFQKRQLKKELRMSKEEIKEEMKQTEGNPQIKSRLRQKQREMAMRRMMHEVPKSTVVVTNPTHFAVALKYEKGQTTAPKVVAKGADFLAFRIKEIAKDANVPIIENKTLARNLYFNVEVDDEIPIELYQAVAELIAYIYSFNK